MGMATVSSAQSKHINMGGNSCCSVSSFCDGGGMLFCGCGSLTRGVGASFNGGLGGHARGNRGWVGFVLHLGSRLVGTGGHLHTEVSGGGGCGM